MRLQDYSHTFSVFLPVCFSAIADAANAVERLEGIFTAEQHTEHLVIDDSLPNAVEVENGNFSWDGVLPEEEDPKKKKKGKAGSDEGEKPIDGRAGPRSENVVLSKSRLSLP